MYTKKKKSHKGLISSVLTLVVIAVAVVGLVIFHHHSKSSSDTTTAMQTSQQKKASSAKEAESPAVTVPNTTPTPTSNVPGGSTGSTDTNTLQLTAPTGTFVSNHGSASDEPVIASSGEASNCTTTPGATCDITFTMSSMTKDLGVKTTPSSTGNLPAGTASWSWTPASIGLTSGTWTITATATLNGQTKTSTDQTNLTVQ
jgi:flagellar basal body-associated protein FliL